MMYACAPHVCRGSGGQQRVSGPLGLALQTVVHLHVGAGNLPRSLRHLTSPSFANSYLEFLRIGTYLEIVSLQL